MLFLVSEMGFIQNFRLKFGGRILQKKKKTRHILEACETVKTLLLEGQWKWVAKMLPLNGAME